MFVPHSQPLLNCEVRLIGESLRGNTIGATGARASEREICLWEGLRGVSQRDGFQRFSEIFSEVLSEVLSSEGRKWGVRSVVVEFGVFGAPQFSVQRSQIPIFKVFWDLCTENRGAPKTPNSTTTDLTPHLRPSDLRDPLRGRFPLSEALGPGAPIVSPLNFLQIKREILVVSHYRRVHQDYHWGQNYYIPFLCFWELFSVISTGNFTACNSWGN